MDAKTIVEREFLLPFARAGRENIGAELEFPLLNLKKEPVSRAVALGLLEEMLSCHGFRVAEHDAEGRPAFLMNQNGDVLSFDNSYNNFEFSMEKGTSLKEISERFYQLFSAVQEYLLPRGYTLCGTGTNPFQEYVLPSAVTFPVYGMVRKFLGQFRGGAYHNYPDFPAYLSSVQTHLDVSEDKLPRAFTLFAALDFVRALMFSNSPAFSGAKGFEETVCFRDYLWEKSGFGSLSANVGKVEGIFSDADDIARLILSRSMFHRVREGQYELIEPVSVQDYFDRADTPEEDIGSYLSFQNVEVTRRGTLEIRSDCAQPISEVFCPPAFNLGILCAMEDAETLLEDFMQKNLSKELYYAPDRNRILRDGVIYHYRLPASENEVRRLLCGLVDIAHSALCKRGKKEEQLIAPLFTRAEQITCPAREWKQRLGSGASLEKVIAEFARI